MAARAVVGLGLAKDALLLQHQALVQVGERDHRFGWQNKKQKNALTKNASQRAPRRSHQTLRGRSARISCCSWRCKPAAASSARAHMHVSGGVDDAIISSNSGATHTHTVFDEPISGAQRPAVVRQSVRACARARVRVGDSRCAWCVVVRRASSCVAAPRTAARARSKFCRRTDDRTGPGRARAHSTLQRRFRGKR